MRRDTLRSISPAPARSRTASAVSAITRTSRSRPERTLDPAPWPSLLNVCAEWLLDAESAGMRPKRSAVARVSRPAATIDGASIRIASAKGSDSGAAAINARTSENASASPAAPPPAARRRLSIINWRTIRPRLAPSAARNATSRARSAPRASSRFARFTHAMSSTSPTPPISTSRPVRTSGSTMSSRSSMRLLLHPARDSGCSCATRAAIALTRARPCSRLTPGCSRATDWKIMLSRRVLESASRLAGSNGNQKSILSGHARWESITPATTNVTPPTRTLRPAMSGSAPKCVRQNRSEMTTARTASAR